MRKGIGVEQSYFIQCLRGLKLKKKYIYFSVFYGLSSLIVPFAAQYLVNSLSLAGILVNTLTFSLVLGLALCVSQVLKFCQVILNEYLQREIYLNEISSWTQGVPKAKAPYFFEIMSLMKTFSASFTHVIELLLLLVFGLLVIIIFHPAFLLLALLLGGVLWLMFSSWKKAIETSLDESQAKYDLYYAIVEERILSSGDVDTYLVKRDKHFYFIKRNKLIVGITFIVSQLILFGIGIYYIQTQQLSIGQLVSAEIILAGILASLTRLPRTLEALFDFETSKIKIERALTGVRSHG